MYYIFILNSTPGFNGLGRDNCKMRWETFKCLDLVWLILEVWWYSIFHFVIVIYSIISCYNRPCHKEVWLYLHNLSMKIPQSCTVEIHMFIFLCKLWWISAEKFIFLCEIFCAIMRDMMQPPLIWVLFYNFQFSGQDLCLVQRWGNGQVLEESPPLPAAPTTPPSMQTVCHRTPFIRKDHHVPSTGGEIQCKGN